MKKYQFLFLFFLLGHELVYLTREIDYAFAANEVSRWMDTYKGHKGGWHHRIKHGHDFLSNWVPLYQSLGWWAALEYPFQLFKDFCTPHGLPIPGTQWAWEQGLIAAHQATRFASLNLPEVFAVFLAIRNHSLLVNHEFLRIAALLGACLSSNLFLGLVGVFAHRKRRTLDKKLLHDSFSECLKNLKISPSKET